MRRVAMHPRRMIRIHGGRQGALAHRQPLPREDGAGSRLPDHVAPHDDILLLKVPSVLFVDEDQIKVVTDRELIVDHFIRRRQVFVPLHKQADGDGFPTDGGTVHHFELGHCFTGGAPTGTGDGFPTDDGQLHVLDFNAHKQKIDFPQDAIF